MGEQNDPSQAPESPEAEAKRNLVDTLAEAQALAALDEMIAKVETGPELGGAAGSAREDARAEAYALTGDVPPLDGWYVARKDNAQGPLTVDDLKELWARGEIGADTLCWREGMGEWRALSRLHGLTAAIAPRPREGLKALSARPPIARGVSQPGFAPSASKMLKSLAEEEAQTAPRPPTSPTTPLKKAPPPAPKPPMFSSELRARLDEDEDDRPARAAGVSGAKLFFSLLSASILGGLAGGWLVKMTIPPPPAPVIVHEAAPAPAPPPPAAAPPVAAQPPPPAAPKAEARPEAPRAEPREREPKREAQPKPPAEPKKPPPPPAPKNPLDKEFQDTFGQ